jgi:ribosomal protein S12 methylthiotransferase accessory factor
VNPAPLPAISAGNCPLCVHGIRENGAAQDPRTMRQEESKSILNAALKAARPEYGIISSCSRLPFYNDEPKLYQYVAELRIGSKASKRKTEFSYGTAFQEETACIKALCEGIERHCLSGRLTGVTRASALKISGPAVKLQDLVYFTDEQLSRPQFRRFRFDEKTRFRWAGGLNVVTGTDTWIPAQLIQLPYEFSGEQMIKFPDSTGAACGTSRQGALLHGILEVLERDLFICWFLTNVEATIIDLPGSAAPRLREIAEVYRRYRLELIVLKLSCEFSFPMVVAIILDRTKVGPAVSIGMKADVDGVSALEGAIAEAQQPRPWQRDLIHIRSRAKRVCTIRTFAERAAFWRDPELIPRLVSLWEREKSVTFEEAFAGYKRQSTTQALDRLIKFAGKFGLDIFSMDVTSPAVRELGFFVVKVVIPQAQPVYFDERYPYWGGRRLWRALQLYGPRWPKAGKTMPFGSAPPHPFI